jgi:EF hand
MMKSTLSKTPLIALASLFLCAVAPQFALAESKAATEVVAALPTDGDFKKLDVNADNKVSLKEAVKDKALATNFDMTDANKDGNITHDEYASYKAAVKGIDTTPAATTTQ